MNTPSRKSFSVLVIVALCCIILVFSPLITPYGKFSPELLGIPYSLWSGILATILMVVLTYFGGKVILKGEEENKS